MTKSLTDTRPAYVEEWLEALPYTDFAKTTRLLTESLQYCNQQEIKPATRFELLELYLHPYEYLLNTWVKTAENSSSSDSRHQYIQPLKQIASELMNGCRMAINESLLKKTRWITSKPPTQGILIGIRLISHLLLLHYQEYIPVPKPVWRELHELYLSADSLGQLSTEVTYPVGDEPIKTCINHVYKQILATSLVDPHHLPFGAIWEIYDQLDTWADDLTIIPFNTPEDPSGLYMIDISHGTVPYSLSKYRVTAKHASLKIIDCRALQKHIVDCQNSLDSDGRLPRTVKFSSLHASTVVSQLQHAYGTPVKRVHPRKQIEGALRVASGVNSVYYHVNNFTEFNMEQENDADEFLGVDNIFASTTDELIKYETEDWNFINESAGGFSIFKNVKPGLPIRIGDLIGINRAANDQNADWIVGAVRWLMVQNDDDYKIGIQTLVFNPQAVAVRALSGGKSDTDFRRAFLFNNGSGSGCLIAPRGLYDKDRSLEIGTGNNKIQVHTEQLLESTVAYEQFTWKN